MTHEEEMLINAVRLLICTIDLSRDDNPDIRNLVTKLYDFAKTNGELAIHLVEGRDAVHQADEAAGNEPVGFTACIVS